MVKNDMKEKLDLIFEGLDIPSPSKIAEDEQELAHVVIDHLYMGALQQLKVAKKELKKFLEDNSDERLVELREDVVSLYEDLENVINKTADKAQSVPNVEGLKKIVKQLEEEMKAAVLLSMETNKKNVVLN